MDDEKPPPAKAAPVAQTMSSGSPDRPPAPFPSESEPTDASQVAEEPLDAAEDPAHADATAASGSQVAPTAARATRGGRESSARSSGERAARAPASEGPRRTEDR